MSTAPCFPPPMMGRVSTALALVGVLGSAHVGGTLAFPTGTQVGDYAILHIALTDIAAGGYGIASGWTKLAQLQTTNPGSGTQGSEVYAKKLVASDLSSPLADPNTSGTSGAYTMAVYRNAISVTCLSATGTSTPRSTGATVSVPGTKTTGSKMWAVAAIDRDGGDNNLTANTQGFVQRGKGITTSGPVDWSVWFLDSATWDGSTTITIGNFLGANEEMAVLLEIK